jgi:hypothetical protein
VGTSVAFLFTVAALVAWYVAKPGHEQSKQVATPKESKSDKSAQSVSDSAPIVRPSVSIAPSVEPSSPLPLARVQPKPVVEQSSQPPVTKPTLNIASITKEHPFENSLGMKFVPVPGTKVLFSVWDTRVKDYRIFADATKHDWPKTTFNQTEEHPAVNVSWDDATAFCKWLAEKERSAG